METENIKIIPIDPEKYPAELLADQSNEARVLFDIGYSSALLIQVRAALAQLKTEGTIDPQDAAFLYHKVDNFLEHRLGVIPEIYEAAARLHTKGII